ncbi:MAG: serine hydrolase [Betaproteobacteria bacterium]|nr:serine hydrolase [Betaproteobacteria bacterium]
MKLARLLPVLILSALGVAQTARAVLPTDAEAEAILKTHLIDKQLVKGAAVALVDAQGIRVVAVGESRAGSALKPDDLFEIGSVTKTFAGLLLAIADESGEAKLDDPVEKFLPDGLKLRDAKGEPIRMADLATHRSGLPRLAPNMRPANQKDPYSDYTEAQLLEFVKGFTATAPRDVKFEYSNIGFGLLGFALTRAAQAESFDALLTMRIFAPLGMTASTTLPTRFAARMTQPHDTAGRPTPAWHLAPAHAAAGAIRSTAGDMGRYVELMAGVKPSPLSAAAQRATTPRAASANPINPIGLAWLKVPFNERVLSNHDGATFGSSASLFVDREKREGVFLVANGSTRLFDVALHLLDRRHVVKTRSFPAIVSVPSDTLAAYVGEYRLNERMVVTVRLRDDKLTAQATGQGEFEIFAESRTRFFAKAAPIVITFGEVNAGRAGQFTLEQGGATLIAKRVE